MSAQALRLLTSGSRRVAFDLRRCLQARYAPWIFARQWTAIPPEMEFRCFMQRRRFIGASQYHHQSQHPSLDSWLVPEVVGTALAGFFPEFASRCSLGDIVYDVLVTGGTQVSVTLIELNPFGPPTDPCLFSWQKFDFDGTLRLREPNGITMTSPPNCSSNSTVTMTRIPSSRLVT